MSEWTREGLGEQILADLRGLIAHMDHPERRRSIPELAAIIKGAFIGFRNGPDGPVTPEDMLILACACCQLARELTLECPEARRKPEKAS